MPDKKRILIVGGGYAGVSAAKALEKKYRKRNDIEIVLVDKKPFHTLMTELHEVAAARTESESVQVSFRKIFGGTKVKVVIDTVKSIDFDKNEAVLTDSVIKYNHIVLGTGADPDFFGIPGIGEHSFTLWSFDDAMRIRRHLEDIWARAAAEPDEAKRRKMLTFTVAGAGFTGIELAGEFVELRDVMCEKYHISRAEVRILVIEALPHILAMFDEKLRGKAERYLQKKGCELMLSSPITAAEEGLVRLKDGSSVETDTLIWTCGVSGSKFAGSLGFEVKRNRIIATDKLQVPGKANVWVAGDNLWFIENEKPLPQVVEAAHQTGHLAALNIIATLEGKELESFKSNYHGYMVSLGGKYGVANAGGMRTSGFIAMAMKHLINVYYLFTITGVTQVWEYLKHEFLDMKDRRSIIGGFAEHKLRGYWAVPLRFWLGFSWVMEGVNKIGEGWLNFDAGSKSGWMFSKGVIQAGVQAAAPVAQAAADAVSQASEQVAGDAAYETVKAIAEAAPAVAAPAVQAVTDAVSQASEQVGEVAGAAGGYAAEAVEGAARAAAKAAAHTFGPVFDLTHSIFNSHGEVATWFRTVFMDGLMVNVPYAAFQSLIVITEIGIGLALFGGAFTWFAAVASIVMCLVFTLSGMFRWDQLWFVFAAILCMGGAGRAFGLDYWIVRFAKKFWNGLKWVRRHHLYLDEPSK